MLSREDLEIIDRLLEEIKEEMKNEAAAKQQASKQATPPAPVGGVAKTPQRGERE